MYNKRLSQRLSGYIGANEKGPWGKKGRELGIDSLRGHSPVATTSLDFGEIPVPSAAALADTPLSWTVTEVGVLAGNSIVANSSNGYLLVTPGTAADTGYGLQALTTDVSPTKVMGFAPSTSMSTANLVRDFYWGARIAFSTNTTWDNALFFGLGSSDTTQLSTTTGLPAFSNAIGFNIDNTGAITIGRQVTTTWSSSSAFTKTATNLAHSSSSFRAQDFHDYFFWAHWSQVNTSSAVQTLQAYIDGNFVGERLLTTLPTTTATMYNSLAVYNGDAANVTLAVSNIVNGYIRTTSHGRD